MIVLSLMSFVTYGQNQTDTIKTNSTYQRQINQDSLNIRRKFVQDSLARRKFIQDSIQAREKFVRDSIQHRKLIIDSLTFLKAELPRLLDAINWTTKDDIISHTEKIAIIGDSVLGDYVYHKLILILSEPYCPWKGRYSLAPKNFHVKIDNKTKKISELEAPSIKCNFYYANQGMLLIIQESNVIQKSNLGNFYKTPIDSVFYDRNKRIAKIKRYIHFYKLTPSLQKGEFMYTAISQVKQYQYDANNQVSQYEMVKFCDRNKVYDPKEVCCIITYAVTKQGKNYQITRRNNPANTYSDGIFSLEYDEHENIANIAFRDFSNKILWQRFVELNKDGNVSCYVDKTNDIKSSTQCMFYHNEPNAKYPVEVIITTYEKDGVDYMQKNITTEKKRVRNKLTLEWGPWNYSPN
jgi:hypothetical protein